MRRVTHNSKEAMKNNQIQVQHWSDIIKPSISIDPGA